MGNVQKIGIIGAGKVGTSLGAYFINKGIAVTGYFDSVIEHAKFAAERTETRCYETLSAILAENEVIIITVPDDFIHSVWDQCRLFPVAGKCFFHCSGALSSDVFSGHVHAGVHVGSLHPVCAVSSCESEDVFSGKFFVLEGDETGLKMLKSLMMTTGNDFRVIASEEKTRYHAAAVASSNLVCAVASMAEDWMMDCGFDGQAAHEMLVPLMLGNMEHIAKDGVEKALTGPVERGDAGTVARHLKALPDNDREIYRLLSLRLVRIARQKHPDKDFTNLLNVLMK
jgi:predicted short-subunit dehydrogenase-like oxidoreductase (DUF2520 family)